MGNTFLKDPDSTLDYCFFWGDWLQSGENINSYVLTVPTGITKDSDSQSSGSVIVWLSGGSDKNDYEVACKITTDASTPRIDERTIKIQVRNR